MNCFVLCFVSCLLVFVLTLIFANRINEKIITLITKIKSKTFTIWETVKNHFKANRLFYIIALVLFICAAFLILYCVRR